MNMDNTYKENPTDFPRRLIREIDLDTGKIVMESYRYRGKLHRDPNEGPALVYFWYETGAIAEITYYWHGRRHRKDGPASVEIDFKGIVVQEFYYKHGLLHRDPSIGPAWIQRGDNGRVFDESYYVYGKPYRDPIEGPWERIYFENGEIESERFSNPEDAPRRSGSVRRRKLDTDPGP